MFVRYAENAWCVSFYLLMFLLLVLFHTYPDMNHMDCRKPSFSTEYYGRFLVAVMLKDCFFKQCIVHVASTCAVVELGLHHSEGTVDCLWVVFCICARTGKSDVHISVGTCIRISGNDYLWRMNVFASLINDTARPEELYACGGCLCICVLSLISEIILISATYSGL